MEATEESGDETLKGNNRRMVQAQIGDHDHLKVEPQPPQSTNQPVVFPPLIPSSTFIQPYQHLTQSAQHSHSTSLLPWPQPNETDLLLAVSRKPTQTARLAASEPFWQETKPQLGVNAVLTMLRMILVKRQVSSCLLIAL